MDEDVKGLIRRRQVRRLKVAPEAWVMTLATLTRGHKVEAEGMPPDATCVEWTIGPAYVSMVLASASFDPAPESGAVPEITVTLHDRGPWGGASWRDRPALL